MCGVGGDAWGFVGGSAAGAAGVNPAQGTAAQARGVGRTQGAVVWPGTIEIEIGTPMGACLLRKPAAAVWPGGGPRERTCPASPSMGLQVTQPPKNPTAARRTCPVSLSNTTSALANCLLLAHGGQASEVESKEGRKRALTSRGPVAGGCCTTCAGVFIMGTPAEWLEGLGGRWVLHQVECSTATPGTAASLQWSWAAAAACAALQQQHASAPG